MGVRNSPQEIFSGSDFLIITCEYPLALSVSFISCNFRTISTALKWNIAMINITNIISCKPDTMINILGISASQYPLKFSELLVVDSLKIFISKFHRTSTTILNNNIHIFNVFIIQSE